MILNTIPLAFAFGHIRPALVLRLSIHLPDEMGGIVDAFKKGQTNTLSYTGGTAHDELASLLSLTHGVRTAIGSISRWFLPNDRDPRGQPRELGSGAPGFETAGQRARIPTLFREAVLSDGVLSSFPRLAPDTAREVVRASRSYRQACWICDSDPNLSWLLLVSAAETAANEWARLRNLPLQTGRELLLEMKPDFADRLDTAAGPNSKAVLEEVGGTLGDVLRAQWKFISFLLQYGIDPPQPRPKAFGLDWSPGAVRKGLNTLYTHRSHALHASQPFPPPMSDPPFPTEGPDGEPAFGERPGGASYTIGGLWNEKDLPMNLHTFEHIVRTACIKWWRDLVGIGNA